MDWSNVGFLTPEEGQHVSSMHLATKQLMGGTPRTYACIQSSEVEIFTFRSKSRQLRKSIKRVYSFAKLQQIHH